MGGFLNVSENRLYLEERLAIRKAGAFMRASKIRPHDAPAVMS
jgi:hypothetical protein